MSTIYLVRHGQSGANKARIWGGDFPLTEEGREQAKSVPGKIPVRPDKVAASMLQRVYTTAELAYPGLEVERNAVFNEIRFGNLELQPMTTETLIFYHTDPEGFQKSIDGDDRIKRANEAIDVIKKYAARYENTAIFLSNTLLVSILTVLEGKTLLETREYYLNNCNVIVLEYDGELTIKDSSSLINITSLPQHGNKQA